MPLFVNNNVKDWVGIPLIARSYTCQNCGIKFTPRAGIQNFCTNECYDKWVQNSPQVDVEKGRFRIFERDNFTCFYCGRSSYSDMAKLHCDHLIPKSKGGKATAENLVTACEHCNLEKSDTMVNDLISIQKEIKRRNKEKKIPDSTKIKYMGEYDENGQIRY